MIKGSDRRILKSGIPKSLNVYRCLFSSACQAVWSV